MKRVFALTIAVIMCLLVVVGCGNGASSGSGDKVVRIGVFEP